MEHETVVPVEEATTGRAGSIVLEAPDFYRLAVAAGEEWTGRGEDPSAAYSKLLSRAGRSIQLVSAQLYPEIFERRSDFFSAKLSSGVSLSILFGRADEGTTGDLESELAATNPETLKLKKHFPALVRLFWTYKRIRLEFAVVDELHTLHQEPDHKSLGRPATVSVYGDSTWGQRWTSRFTEVVKSPNCREI